MLVPHERKTHLQFERGLWFKIFHLFFKLYEWSAKKNETGELWIRWSFIHLLAWKDRDFSTVLWLVNVFFHTCYDRGKTTPIIWKNKWWEGRAKHSNKYVLGGSSRDVTWSNVNLSFEVTLQSSVNVKPQWKLIPSWNKVHCGIFGLCNQF